MSMFVELHSAIKNRLECGESARSIARRAGLPLRAIQNIVEGHQPSLDRAAKICNVLGLEAYIGPPRGKTGGQVSEHPATYDITPNVVIPFDPDEHGAGHALIPKLNVRASAGSGAINDNENAEHLLVFRRDWLHKRGLQADYLNAIEVTGDSMVPTFNEGDTILVDRSRSKALKIGKVVVARLNDDEVVIKRLNKLSDGQYCLTSDNPTYNPVIVKKTDVLVGEVVWRGVWLEQV